MTDAQGDREPLGSRLEIQMKDGPDRLDRARDLLRTYGEGDVTEAQTLVLIDIAESLRMLSHLLPAQLQQSITEGVWGGLRGQ